MSQTLNETRSPHAVRLVDLSGQSPSGPDIWAPLKVSAAEIEAAIVKLAEAPRPANGVRALSFVHPQAVAPGLGFAPGVSIRLVVLNPGETSDGVRSNASQVELCIQGSGRIEVDGRTIPLARWDVCNIPSMRTTVRTNDGDAVWACLVYANTPLLEKLGVAYSEAGDAIVSETATDLPQQKQAYVRETAPDILIAETGARLRGYEFLTDIEVVENQAHHWPYARISTDLSQVVGDGKRQIMLLYNPATERRNGTTHSFFVTLSSTPPGLPQRRLGRGHRHSSVAINYHLKGSGSSLVDGQRIDWSAGDLLLSGPGWSEHGHAMSEEGASVITVQDHPLHIGMESLIWQERMDGPILTLGSETGQTGYVGPRERGD